MSGEGADASSVIQHASESAPGAEEAAAPMEGESPEQVTETPESQEATPKTEDLDYARGWNALTRRERHLMEQERSLKDQMGKVKSYEESMDLLKSDPVAFMEKNGWTFNQLADFMLNDRKPTAETKVEKLMSRIEQLEHERKTEKEQRELAEKTKKQQETIDNFKNQLKKHISGKTEDYELVNHFGEFDTVYDVIEEEYNKSGQILDIDTAAKWVEQYLETQMEKAAATKKFKSRFSPMEESAKKEDADVGRDSFPPSRGESYPPRTLTNSEAASTPAPADERWLSDEESKANAAKMLQEAWMKSKGYSRQ